MELLDLNMIDKVLSNKEFTLQEYISNTTNSKNDIEIQVDHLDRELKLYRHSRILFGALAIIFSIFLILNVCFVNNVSLTLIVLNVLLILICVIVVNLNGIIINKIYLIEMANQVVGIYYKRYEDTAGKDIRSIMAKY